MNEGVCILRIPVNPVLCDSIIEAIVTDVNDAYVMLLIYCSHLSLSSKHCDNR